MQQYTLLKYNSFTVFDSVDYQFSRYYSLVNVFKFLAPLKWRHQPILYLNDHSITM